MQHIYDNIMYAELNTERLLSSGFDGEIKIVEDDGSLYGYRTAATRSEHSERCKAHLRLHQDAVLEIRRAGLKR